VPDRSPARYDVLTRIGRSSATSAGTCSVLLVEVVPVVSSTETVVLSTAVIDPSLDRVVATDCRTRVGSVTSGAPPVQPVATTATTPTTATADSPRARRSALPRRAEPVPRVVLVCASERTATPPSFDPQVMTTSPLVMTVLRPE
jgi:hypothetical protein